MRKIQFSIILVFFFSMLFGNQVDLSRAEKVAKNIYFERVNLNNKVDIKEINLTHIYTETKDGYNLYYIFDVNQNDGFVIVAADDVVKPIIGYSFERNYNLDNISPEHAFYMGKFKKQISDAIANNVRPSEEVISEWQKYEFATKSINEIQSVQPLIITTWGQSYPYNEMCPVEGGQHCVVGCVAISFSQLMKYWNYPAQGTGTHSYYDLGSGTQSANYGNTEYHFENMPYDASGENDYLARLLYHCGVAVNMDYGVDGSGSQTTRIVTGLENYFKYSTDAEYVSMGDYTAAAWLALLKSQIDNGWPMSYDGFSSEGGHAWNCDGYQGDEFHMNWGWDGYQNGFYAVSGGQGYSTEGAVINVYPLANYPEGCAAKTITGSDGSFNDGSGNQNYENNLDCTYHIMPECGTYVTIDFERFMLGAGDHVYIYDGSTTSADLLADYDNSVTSPANVTSTTPDGILINFVTDASGTAEGWYASYRTTNCAYSTTLTAPSGEVEDGSKLCNYDNSSLCKWYIEPTSATSITIDFSEFDLADASDYLKIYKGHSTASADLIADLRAGDNPNIFNVIDSKATVRFGTASGDVGAGWKFNYNISTTNINDINSFVNNVKVYPNPFNTDATIEFNTNTTSNVNISIVNVLGAKVGEINRVYTNGTQSVKVSEIVSNIDNGIYFVKFNSDELEKTIKIIVTE